MRLKNEQNLEFNVPGGKLNRGMSVVDSVKILRGRALSDDECTLKPLLGSWHVPPPQAHTALNVPGRQASCKRSCSSSSRTTS